MMGMTEVGSDQLKEAVERMHGGAAAFAQSVPVHESFDASLFGKAWYTSSISPTTRPRPAPPGPRLSRGAQSGRFFAVLHQPPVDSPQAAVGAAIVAEQRQRQTGCLGSESAPVAYVRIAFGLGHTPIRDGPCRYGVV